MPPYFYFNRKVRFGPLPGPGGPRSLKRLTAMRGAGRGTSHSEDFADAPTDRAPAAPCPAPPGPAVLVAGHARAGRHGAGYRRSGAAPGRPAPGRPGRAAPVLRAGPRPLPGHLRAEPA